MECLPGWDGGLEQSFTIQVLEEIKEVMSHVTNSESGATSQKNEVLAQGIKPPEMKVDPLNEKGTPLVLANTATSPDSVFMVEGLKGGKSYLVSIRAVNAKGQSEASLLRIVTTSEEKLKRVSQGKKWQ